MITVKIYKNGIEIVGHDTPYFCTQVSLWFFILRNLMAEYHDTAKSYTSADNDNMTEGYSWLTFDADCPSCKKLFDYSIQLIKAWCDGVVKRDGGRVAFERIDSVLEKAA